MLSQPEPNAQYFQLLNNQQDLLNQQIYQGHAQIPDRNLGQNSAPMNATSLRLNHLESRMETMEKMLKFFDEFLNLKEEEKGSEVFISTPKLHARVDALEKKINDIERQNKDLRERNKEIK